MLNFDFLDKGIGIVSPAHFVYDFSTKMLFMFILLTDKISLHGCLYFNYQKLPQTLEWAFKVHHTALLDIAWITLILHSLYY